ncbi:AAA family ATPase [Aliirhizobium terrae]|uniref:AAA family ATPase n=1 Tax=Terrirhizobium terrae TaxID=2926709 RepID=UPI002575D542|nr:AAA family ATPase [Rhizobium sp. CC-CFT758]WJH41317.1 AAA family ATPase [Rhizobium sp. CC-CFT758]
MLLRSMSARNYRSLKSIGMDLAGVNLFIGENGVGKSNLYRALQLIQAAVRGTLAQEIAAEGGMASALWSGHRRNEKNFRIKLNVEVLDDERAITFRYRVEAGLRPPKAAAGFAFEPQIKEEELSIETGSRPVTMMKRAGPGIMVRGADNRMQEYPEIGAFRRMVESWRFFHGFRTDRDAPMRQPCLAVTAPLLDEDGANVAAVFATLEHIRGNTIELNRAIGTAFDGPRLHVPEPGEYAEFGLVFPHLPLRVFTPRELSDGQIRFLGLAAALMSYRQPPLIALNEPEASLHPDMLEPLADMIAAAAQASQIWIVTHSEQLAAAVQGRCGVRAKRVIRKDGATWIEGMRLTGMMDEDDEDE